MHKWYAVKNITGNGFSLAKVRIWQFDKIFKSNKQKLAMVLLYQYMLGAKIWRSQSASWPSIILNASFGCKHIGEQKLL